MSTAAMAVAMAKPVKGAKRVVARFSFKNSRRGAIIFGLAGGGMIALQGMAFVATYTTEIARAKFAISLAANPTIGIFYGEPRSINTPAGYMVYRSLAFMSLLGAIWALSVSTRLLRGQEDDGRLEVLLAGPHALASATMQIVKGLAGSFGLAFILSALTLVILGQNKDIQVTPQGSLYIAVALFVPVAIFMAFGILASQLAPTRRQAMVYGLALVIICFAMRSIGNVVASLHWLKYFTPFGWVDRMHPVTGSDAVWLVPAVFTILALLGTALLLVKRRDMGESIIADKDSARPRLTLLNSPLGLSFRMTRGTLFGWLLATLGMAALFSAIAKTAAEAVVDSGSLTDAVAKLSGHGTLVLAFVGLGGFFTALMLMIVVASGMGRVREDEAKGYAENFLVNPVSRTRYLLGRIVILVGAVLVICFLANFLAWYLARVQDIVFPWQHLLVDGFNFAAPALMMLGVGVLVYGLKPRLTSLILYAWIIWSFLIEMIGSVVHFSPWMLRTSLLRQVSTVPSEVVDWKKFAVVVGIGVVMGAVGLLLFAHRDLESE